MLFLRRLLWIFWTAVKSSVMVLQEADISQSGGLRAYVWIEAKDRELLVIQWRGGWAGSEEIDLDQSSRVGWGQNWQLLDLHEFLKFYFHRYKIPICIFSFWKFVHFSFTFFFSPKQYCHNLFDFFLILGSVRNGSYFPKLGTLSEVLFKSLTQ